MKKKITQSTDNKEKRTLSPYEKVVVRRDIFCLLASIIVSLAFSVFGVLFLKEKTSENFLSITLAITVSLTLIALAVNFTVSLALIKRWNTKDKREILNFVYSHRDHAEKSARSLEKKLSILIAVTNVYTVFTVILGIAIATTAGALGATTIVLLSALIIYAAISRIHFPTPSVLFSSDNGYVIRDDFPELYAVAEEAAGAIGIAGDIKICILSDFSAGIRRFDKKISVQIGALLYGAISREELKSILLHEFAHLISDGDTASKLHNHHYFLDESRATVSVSRLTGYFYQLFDGLYMLNYMLYSYASTIGVEEKADEAMLKHGEARYAGSAFLKLKYYELYDWEKGSYDSIPYCAREILSPDLLKNELKGFEERTALRRDFWNKLIDVEIISRVATHPTIKMRLDALGHTDYSLHSSEDSKEYKTEQNKVVEFIDGKIYERRKESYDNDRKEFYLKPLELVTKWENEGKEITPEGYREIVYSYRQLDRESDAMELCNRAIELLPNSASHYAYFIKGAMLLHSFDEAGIEYIYHAIEENNNYIDEGLEAIGQFCCICGRQDDLEVYRERALQLADEQEKKYSELNHISTKDNLTEETLPNDIHKGLMSLVSSQKEYLKTVYLVRKIITDDFFASIVILEFEDTIENDKKYEVLDKFFLYLDTQDWQFSLFDSSRIPMNQIKKMPQSVIYKKDAQR